MTDQNITIGFNSIQGLVDQHKALAQSYLADLNSLRHASVQAMLSLGVCLTLYMLFKKLFSPAQREPLLAKDEAHKDIENAIREREAINDHDDYYNTPGEVSNTRKINFGLVNGFLAKQETNGIDFKADFEKKYGFKYEESGSDYS